MDQAVAESRVYNRHHCQVRTSCKPAAANESRWDGVIEDVSQGGICLRLRRRFELGTGLAIDLPGNADGVTDTVYARVVHLKNAGDGSYILGCKFMSELSVEEVQRIAFTSPSAAEPAVAEPAVVEQASADPLETQPLAIVPGVRLLIGVGEGEVIRCRVKRFHSPGAWPLVPGKSLNLRGVARDGTRLEHPFEVVDCNREGEGWLLQVRTTDPLQGEEVLAAFGR